MKDEKRNKSNVVQIRPQQNEFAGVKRVACITLILMGILIGAKFVSTYT